MLTNSWIGSGIFLVYNAADRVGYASREFYICFTDTWLVDLYYRVINLVILRRRKWGLLSDIRSMRRREDLSLFVTLWIVRKIVSVRSFHKGRLPQNCIDRYLY